MADHTVRAPSTLLTLLEQRALFEVGAFMASSPVLRLMGRGDHHPVLVLPGFTAGDRSTLGLRWFLRGQGYWVHGWRLGQNLGPTRRITAGLSERLQEVYDRQERKVSLVGWSLGGIYARELARRHPELVRQVITLGSPFQMRADDRSAVSALVDTLEASFDRAWFEGLLERERDRAPLTVPSTAIYTRSDGIVRWYTCIDEPGQLRENIEVRGSHSGLGFNPAVLAAVADRLAQREGTWKPFRPAPCSGHIYPRAASYRAA